MCYKLQVVLWVWQTRNKPEIISTDCGVQIYF
jgi:hypothetical protein